MVHRDLGTRLLAEGTEMQSLWDLRGSRTVWLIAWSRESVRIMGRIQEESYGCYVDWERANNGWLYQRGDKYNLALAVERAEQKQEWECGLSSGVMKKMQEGDADVLELRAALERVGRGTLAFTRWMLA